LATSAPAVLPVAPYVFSSFLTMTHGRLVRQLMLGRIRAPLSSMVANLSILLVDASCLILSAAMSARMQRSLGDESRNARST